MESRQNPIRYKLEMCFIIFLINSFIIYLRIHLFIIAGIISIYILLQEKDQVIYLLLQ